MEIADNMHSNDQQAKNSIVHLLPNRLALVSVSSSTVAHLKKDAVRMGLKLVSSDLHQRYFPFASDFGPVNIGVVCRFCAAFSAKMSRDDHLTLVYCIEEKFEAQANASFLLGTLLVLMHSKTAEEAADHFTGDKAPFTLQLFRDVTVSNSTYGLSLLDCLKGLSKAVKLGWFNLRSFDLQTYEFLDNPMNGDVHKICPKLVAFKGPLQAGSKHKHPNEVAFPPEHYAPILHDLGVTCVVRLNDPDTYDGAEFERAGIAHHDLFFDDSTVPPGSASSTSATRRRAPWRCTAGRSWGGRGRSSRCG